MATQHIGLVSPIHAVADRIASPDRRQARILAVGEDHVLTQTIANFLNNRAMRAFSTIEWREMKRYLVEGKAKLGRPATPRKHGSVRKTPG